MLVKADLKLLKVLGIGKYRLKARPVRNRRRRLQIPHKRQLAKPEQSHHGYSLFLNQAKARQLVLGTSLLSKIIGTSYPEFKRDLLSQLG